MHQKEATWDNIITTQQQRVQQSNGLNKGAVLLRSSVSSDFLRFAMASQSRKRKRKTKFENLPQSLLGLTMNRFKGAETSCLHGHGKFPTYRVQAEKKVPKIPFEISSLQPYNDEEKTRLDEVEQRTLDWGLRRGFCPEAGLERCPPGMDGLNLSPEVFHISVWYL